MAAIGTIELQIAPGDGDTVRVIVGYEISATHDDILAGTRYHEVVQLYRDAARVIWGPRGAVPVTGGLLLDQHVVFTANEQSFVHGAEKTFPLAALEGGLGPFDRDAVWANVTLTPLPVAAIAASSNAVILEDPPVVEA